MVTVMAFFSMSQYLELNPGFNALWSTVAGVTSDWEDILMSLWHRHVSDA